jgi:DNA-directed RNA polymerase subunit RPC12/RpoP
MEYEKPCIDGKKHEYCREEIIDNENYYEVIYCEKCGQYRDWTKDEFPGYELPCDIDGGKCFFIIVEHDGELKYMCGKCGRKRNTGLLEMPEEE